MKKLVLFAAFVALVAFSSCSNKAKEEPAVETPTEEVVAPVEEPTAAEVAPADSTVVAPAETPEQAQ
jgi:outer membrane murein-binding lipoprotein Lpp